jgi:hypothetical protein
VHDLDLAQAEDELYALPPDDFRAARDERAAQARAAGDKDLARAITALRRPVVSAWLVNTLARTEPGQMAELLALGESLRDAQEALDGDRLRELSVQRRQLVAAMVDAAKQVAERDGRTVSLQVEREVEATLQAALADPGAAEAVSAGRLAGPLSYAGLGAGEATPLRPVRPARPAVAHKDPAVRSPRGDRAAQPEVAARRAARESGQREAAAAERKEREAVAARRAAEQAVQDAAGAAGAARGALDDAEQTVTSARAAQEAVRRRAEQLDRELAEALAEQSRATRAVRDAQRSRDTAARALDAAAKRLARARQAASRLAATASDAAAAPASDTTAGPASDAAARDNDAAAHEDPA